jgi:hypothetical protein
VLFLHPHEVPYEYPHYLQGTEHHCEERAPYIELVG